MAEGSLISTDPSVAAAALAAGNLAALPTETVYGLAADASNPLAIERLFRVKGRPNSHPVIVHVPSGDAVSSWARDVPGFANELIDQFWPGPLTLILKRSALASDAITGSQDTVAVRCSSSSLFAQVLTDFASHSAGPVGLAAPSANRFGRVSPTTAAHVVAELGDELIVGRDVVLNGGPTEIGIESTIVDCTSTVPRIARLGFITESDINEVVRTTDNAPEPAIGTPRAPGGLASHYSPTAAVQLVNADELKTLVIAPSESVGLIALAAIDSIAGTRRLSAPSDNTEFANQLYAALHAADEQGINRVLVVPPAGDHGAGIADAIRDRLTRASAER